MQMVSSLGLESRAIILVFRLKHSKLFSASAIFPDLEILQLHLTTMWKEGTNTHKCFCGDIVLFN